MLFASLIMILLVKARNDVMFAHCAFRRNIIHAANITRRSRHHLPARANIVQRDLFAKDSTLFVECFFGVFLNVFYVNYSC